MVNDDQHYKILQKHLSHTNNKLQKNEKSEGYIIDAVYIGQNYIVLQLPKAIYTFRFGNTGPKIPFIYSFKKLSIPLITEYNDISLYNIITSSHPNRIIVNYIFKEKEVFVIWDFENNTEVSSFSSRDNDTFL